MTRRVPLTIAAAVLAGWLISVCGYVRHFGSSAAWMVGQGWVGVYWRGDPELRKGYLYNGGEWPLHEDTNFAGGEPPENAWETYGPDIILWELRQDLKDDLAALFHDLGVGWPDVRITQEAACVVVPLGPAGATAAFVLCWLFVMRSRNIRSGCCPICGYDLRASSQRCPECGMSIPPAAEATA